MTIQRPNGYEHENRDCTVRALSLASNIPYEIVHAAFKKYGRKDKHGFHTKKKLRKVCKELHLNFKQIKRHGTVQKLLDTNKTDNLFCTVRGHAFTIIKGVAHDLTNTNKHIDGAWVITNNLENDDIDYHQEDNDTYNRIVGEGLK
jgi:hypothetical protein